MLLLYEKIINLAIWPVSGMCGTLEVREATKYVRGSDIYRSIDNQSVTKYASKQTNSWESEVEVVASETNFL